MKAVRLCLGFTVVLAMIGLFAAPATAHADTYQIFDLGSGFTSDLVSIVGITASGTAVLDQHVPVGAPLCAVSGICQEYETWVNGVETSFSPTAPNLVYDNGAPCTLSPSFLTFSVTGTCNNGHEVYSAGPAAMPPYTDDTFTGPDPVADLFTTGPTLIQNVDLNASGDFVFNQSHPAGDGGENFEAIDLTTETPEPASIFLVVTGLFAAAETIRRRLLDPSPSVS